MTTALRRVITAARYGLREYRRTPILVALLVFLPAYFILAFRFALPDQAVTLPAGTLWPRVSTDLVTAYMALQLPLVGATFGGIAGLFLVRLTTDADRRLVIAGYRPTEVLAARFLVLGIAACLVTIAAVAVASTDFSPEHVDWFIAATLLATVTYGLLGVIAGRVLSTLAGVYLMLFAPALDIFLVQNPTIPGEPWFAPLLPGYHAVHLSLAATYATTIAAGDAIPALAYLAVVVLIAGGVVHRTIRVSTV